MNYDNEIYEREKAQEEDHYYADRVTDVHLADCPCPFCVYERENAPQPLQEADPEIPLLDRKI